jgi:hypothetical protein
MVPPPDSSIPPGPLALTTLPPREISSSLVLAAAAAVRAAEVAFVLAEAGGIGNTGERILLPIEFAALKSVAKIWAG